MKQLILFLVTGLALEAQQNIGLLYCPDTGIANAISCQTSSVKLVSANTIQVSPLYISNPYTLGGPTFLVLVANTNTGPTTIAINNQLPVNVTKNGSTPLSGSELTAGSYASLTFDGAEMVVGSSGTTGVSQGTANQICISGTVISICNPTTVTTFNASSVTVGTTGNIGSINLYDASGIATDVTSYNGIFELPGGSITVGVVGSQQGSILLAGSTSGGATLSASSTGILQHGSNYNVATVQEQFATGTITNSTGTAIGFKVVPTYNQTSTAGATDILIQRTETAVGSGPQNFLVGEVSTTPKFIIDHNGVYENSGAQPALTGSCNSSTQTGGTTAGTFKNTSNPCTAGTFILTFPFTALNAWVCTLYDFTTNTDTFKMTSTSNTSCTMTGTAANNDILYFTATPF